MSLPCVHSNPKSHESSQPPKQARNTSFPVKSFITVLIISGAFFAHARSLKAPGFHKTKLLPDSVYIPLLAIQLMQVWNSSTDTVALDSIKQTLFKSFGVDEKQFLNSHRYYQSDFEGQRTRLDSVKILIETEKRRIQEFERDSD